MIVKCQCLILILLLLQILWWQREHTFFPRVSSAEWISRLRMLWVCSSCEGRVLLNWLSPMTFWVRSRSPAQFSCVGSLVRTDLRCSRSFTTTHNCKVTSTVVIMLYLVSIWYSKCLLGLCSPCWWHCQGQSSLTAPSPSPSGCDSSSPLSYTHPENTESSMGNSWFSQWDAASDWNHMMSLNCTSVSLTMSMKASSGSGHDSCSHSLQMGWIHANRSTAEELCLIVMEPHCRGWSWEEFRRYRTM